MQNANKTRGAGPLGGGGMVGLWGRSGLIVSVQRGSIAFGTSNLTATATISPVITANAFVSWCGGNNGGVDNDGLIGYMTLTNSTTVTCTRGYQDGANGATNWYEVIEYAPGMIKSQQSAFASFLSSALINTTITSVTMNKTVLIDAGRWSGSFVAVSYTGDPSFSLTSATNVYFTVGGGGVDYRRYITVVEFF